MKKLLAALLFVPSMAFAAGGGYRLDTAPIDPNDVVSLQSGARTFVNYCMNCHGAQYMRYNRLTDIGLTEAQILDNFIFTGEKIGATMKVALSPAEGKAWFGVAPPDLSVIGRSRGADWLYTYLRTFYRDPKTTTGWNNAVFPQVAMPHALWMLQGERAYDAAKHEWTEVSPGAMSRVQYDIAVRDLVNFLVYVGEPSATKRKSIGIIVLFVLGVLFIFAYALKKEYWKDVK
jgi:ubiquinol-cytochrome c reductase cytochrome c1 subunit